MARGSDGGEGWLASLLKTEHRGHAGHSDLQTVSLCLCCVETGVECHDACGAEGQAWGNLGGVESEGDSAGASRGGGAALSWLCL